MIVPVSLLLMAAAHTDWHVIAFLKSKDVGESSGIAVSVRNPGIFWTHNDSGDGPFVYAFDKKGENRGTFRLEGVVPVDWEDMAVGPCPHAAKTSCLYMGDIGDNGRVRKEIQVYVVPEPAVRADAVGSDRKHATPLGGVHALRLRYPDRAHDAETLLVHPKTGTVYVVTKQRRGEGASLVFKAPSPGTVHELKRVAEVRTDSTEIPVFGFAFMITGGSISNDGRRVVLRDYIQAYEFTLPDDAKDFDEIWQTQPVGIDVGTVKQGESIAYGPFDHRLYLTSEGYPSPLVEVLLGR